MSRAPRLASLLVACLALEAGAVDLSAEYLEIVSREIVAPETVLFPDEIAVDADGNVFVVTTDPDQLLGNVLRIGSDGAISVLVPPNRDGANDQIYGPSALAVDAQGNVYVSGFGSNNVVRYTPAGDATELIDLRGDGQGNFLSAPRGLDVDDAGNLYVAGAFSSNVFRVTPAGVITELVDAASAPGSGLDEAERVAVDHLGNVFVAGRQSRNVLRIAPDGTVTEVLDATGGGTATALQFPEDVVVDGLGNLYVSDGLNLFRVTPAGVVTALVTNSFGLRGIRADGAGNVFFPQANRISKIGLDDFREVVFPPGSGVGDHVLEESRGIAIGADGSLYVSDWEGQSVFEVAPDGSIEALLGYCGDGIARWAEFLTGPAVTADGALYFSGWDAGNVFRQAPGGLPVEILEACPTEPVSVEKPNVPVLGPDGSVYVAGFDSDNVVRVDPSGAATEVIDASGDGLGNELDGPWAIAVDDAGHVFVAGITSDNVFGIAPTGAITQILDRSGDGVNDFDSPRALAVDRRGNLFAAGGSSSNVFRIGADGSIEQVIDETGGGLALLRFPGSLATDTAGNLYVLAGTSDTAFRVSPSGEITQLNADRDPFWSGLRDIAIDIHDNVWVTAHVSDNLVQINPYGVETEVLGPFFGPFLNPSGIDTDGDGRIYVQTSRAIARVTMPPECDDTIDNDGDGDTDHPADPDCFVAVKPREGAACDDGRDNDADGLVDWDGAGAGDPDPDCAGSPTGGSEGGCVGGGAIALALPLLLVLCARRR